MDLFLATTAFHSSMADRVEHQPFGEATIPVLSIEDLLMIDWLGRFLSSEDPRLDRIKAILG